MSVVICGKIVIVGIGSVGVGEVLGYSVIELFGQVLFKVIVDVGLKFFDIDVVFVVISFYVFFILLVVEYFGICLKFVDGINIGGFSFELYLLQVILVLEVGFCDVVLICYGFNQ